MLSARFIFGLNKSPHGPSTSYSDWQYEQGVRNILLFVKHGGAPIKHTACVTRVIHSPNLLPTGDIQYGAIF